MRLCLLTGAALLLGASQAAAGSMALSPDGAIATQTGTVAWTPQTADSSPALDDSYTLQIATAGTPFAAGFAAPAVDAPVELPGPGGVQIGNPAPLPASVASSGLRLGLTVTSEAIPATAPAGVTQNVLAFERAINQFPNGPLDGTAFADVALFFNDDFSHVTGVVIDFTTEAPLFGADFFDVTRHLGFDGVGADLPVPAAPPVGGPVAPVPLPPSVALLLAGLGGLGLLRRLSARSG